MIIKELEEGSIVAINHPDKSGIMPQLATAIKLPKEKNLKMEVKIHWLEVKAGQKQPLVSFTIFNHLARKTMHQIIQYKNILFMTLY